MVATCGDRAAPTIKLNNQSEGGIEKSVMKITVWHYEACRVMVNGDPEGPIFQSHSHTNNISPLTFLVIKFLNTLRCNIT